MDSYIDYFKEYLVEEIDYSNKTGITYKEALNEYKKFLNTNHYSFLNISSDIANQYKAYLIKKNYESKTASLYLSAVRTFYQYLVEIKATSRNPFLSVRNPKVVKKLPNFLNHSENEKLFSSSKIQDDLGFRNEFIIEFLYTTGLRVSELCNVKMQDFIMGEGKLRVMGKGSKERIVFYKASNPNMFDTYINVIRPRILNGIESDYLIVSKTGKLSSRSIEKIVKNIALNKDVKSKVTPHTLRHSYATDLLNRGADIRSVGELLGHESLSTTQIYTHVTIDHLKEVYNKTHPRK